MVPSNGLRKTRSRQPVVQNSTGADLGVARRARNAAQHRVDPSTKYLLTPKEIESPPEENEERFLDYAMKERNHGTYGRPVAVMSLAVPTNSTFISTNNMLRTEKSDIPLPH